MGLDFTLLSHAIKSNEIDLVYISEEKDMWIFGLWTRNTCELTRQFATLISKQELSQDISLKTILEFLPKEGITFKSDIPVVKSILKEMKLCQ